MALQLHQNLRVVCMMCGCSVEFPWPNSELLVTHLAALGSNCEGTPNSIVLRPSIRERYRGESLFGGLRCFRSSADVDLVTGDWGSA